MTLAGDLLTEEKSLEFYRGTMTKDAIKEIDSRLSQVLKLLAPYLLDSATHKILEFLIRIYEVHAFHKAQLVLAFFPYFETVFFIKCIQIANVKSDEGLAFLDPFAFKGEQLDKKTFIKHLSKNDALLMARYATYCGEL